jgi:hypothetical protein
MAEEEPRRALAGVESTIGQRIQILRGERVLLDADLAELYGVKTKRLNEAVRRNRARFPSDFMLQLSAEEARSLRSQFATSSSGGSGGRRYLPYAFTEQGVAMLSSVLRSPRAIAVNVLIMRTFVQLRRSEGQYAELRQKLMQIARRVEDQDELLTEILSALEALGQPPTQPSRPIGFRAPDARVLIPDRANDPATSRATELMRGEGAEVMLLRLAHHDPDLVTHGREQREHLEPPFLETADRLCEVHLRPVDPLLASGHPAKGGLAW